MSLGIREFFGPRGIRTMPGFALAPSPPRVVAEDPIVAGWGRTTHADGRVTEDLIVDSKSLPRANRPILVWMTSTGAALNRRARAGYLFIALLFFVGTFPSFATLTNVPTATAASAAVGAAIYGLGPRFRSSSAPRGPGGGSVIYRPAKLGERAVLDPVLCEAVRKAGRKVTGARRLTRYGTFVEWQLDASIRVGIQVRIADYDKGPFWITVKTSGLENQEHHQRLKGEILDALRAAAGMQPDSGSATSFPTGD
jgi:hypothetical protein